MMPTDICMLPVVQLLLCTQALNVCVLHQQDQKVQHTTARLNFCMSSVRFVSCSAFVDAALTICLCCADGQRLLLGSLGLALWDAASQQRLYKYAGHAVSHAKLNHQVSAPQMAAQHMS